jgi:UDP-glucose 4-epimerase
MTVCLVTGGAGFIGSHLVDALVARGDVVRVLDNFSSGSLANLAQAKGAIELIAADANDPLALKRAVRDAEYVFHFVEPCGEPGLEGASTPGKWVYAADTLNVLTAAHQAGVHRVIFASSGSVYGATPAPDLKEGAPTMPVSPCGFAKQTAENQCAGFTMLYGLETVRLRFFNVFGPRQSPTTRYAPVIPAILQSMLGGQNPVIHDSPFEQQDFLYIADAVHATLLAAEATRVAGKVYNIARGRSAYLVQVVIAVNQILGTHLQHLFSDAGPPSEPVRSVNIARAEAELGFCPSNDLKQGLCRYIDYLHRHPAILPKALPDALQPGSVPELAVAQQKPSHG